MAGILPQGRTGEILDGRYRLEEQVGAGGVGAVYRAVDELLGRTVAVKLFPPGAAEPTDAARKASETRVLASLNHHALVTLFDANIDAEDGAYLVMEYVSGPTLAQRIAKSPLPSADVAAMAVDLAEALHSVHEARVVHRDIKPSNVLLQPALTTGAEFRAKLADFGIAYLIDSTRVTTPGMLVGTVAYVSPEQVRGAAPATPADVYALGLVLLEALTGRRAYPQLTTHDALMARLNEPPEIPGELGYEWKSLLSAMTSTNADDRPTALEVATALRRTDFRAAEPDITSAMGVSGEEWSAAPASAGDEESDAPPVTAQTIELEPERHDEPEATAQSETTAETVPPRRPGASDAPDAGRRRRSRRRIAVALIVLIFAAVITGVVLWLQMQSGGAAPAPDLPALPEPLGTDLDRLMKEVTP